MGYTSGRTRSEKLVFTLDTQKKADTLTGMDELEELLPENSRPTIVVAVILFLILVVATVTSYQYAKKRTGAVVLPGGTTYLGPSPTPPPVTVREGQIPVPDTASWGQHKGQTFPYSFEYPTTLSLGFFPGDPFDGVTVFYENTDPQKNIFLRVENLKEMTGTAGFVNQSKLEYVKGWWKQYNWNGVASVTAFTNSHGLTGYRAKYLDNQGTSPYDNVFFEIPNRPELVIWISGKLFPQPVFDRMVDSLIWK